MSPGNGTSGSGANNGYPGTVPPNGNNSGTGTGNNAGNGSGMNPGTGSGNSTAGTNGMGTPTAP
jgi:penicillin amidase